MHVSLGPVGAALLASAITAMASLGVLAYQEWRRSRAADLERLEAAYVQVLSASLSVSTRAMTLGEAIRYRSGVTDRIDTAFGLRKQVDHFELHDWLAPDWNALSTACAVIWTRGDQEGVRLANAVAGSCADLLGAKTSSQVSSNARERLRRWVIGERWSEQMTHEHDAAIKALAEARRRFAEHGRSQFGSKAVDLFA